MHENGNTVYVVVYLPFAIYSHTLRVAKIRQTIDGTLRGFMEQGVYENIHLVVREAEAVLITVSITSRSSTTRSNQVLKWISQSLQSSLSEYVEIGLDSIFVSFEE